MKTVGEYVACGTEEAVVLLLLLLVDTTEAVVGGRVVVVVYAVCRALGYEYSPVAPREGGYPPPYTAAKGE